MSDSTIFYEGKELTAQQAFVVGNLNRLIRGARAEQMNLKERCYAVRTAWNRGNALRHERGLTEDQDTEWEYPCGTMRLGQLVEAIDSLQGEIRNFDTDIRAHTFRLQQYIDSLAPVAVPASEAPNGADEDDGTPSTTCCPGGEQAGYDSSSSDDEDEDVEGRAEWIKFNTFPSDEEDDE
tara:strand:- start:51 stop:590 length:540 start_codon:yes stop_codon:yes gene_type:complete